MYLAGAITKVQAGYAITSIVNTTEEAMEIDEPVLSVTEVETGTSVDSRATTALGATYTAPGKC